MNFEPIQSGHKLVGWPLGSVFGMHHEEHVRESGTEICAIGVMMSGGLGGVNIHALWAVQLDHSFTGYVTEPDRQHLLVFAVYPGTVTKVPGLVFLDHLGDTTISQNVACVYKAVKQFSRLFNEVGLVGIVFELVIRFEVKDHVQGLSVMGNLLIEASQVEFVLDVVFVNLEENMKEQIHFSTVFKNGMKLFHEFLKA